MRKIPTLLLAVGLLGSVSAQPLIDFPTANRALLEGRPDDFYMYVDRTFEGKTTQPWEAGQYGFVRDPKRFGDTITYTRFHEGIDIKPLDRDPSGNPLDPVVAAAAGTVVYASDAPGASNYGRYVVVEHVIDGSPYYTLYAHLASISVAVGQPIRQGEKLGILGYTGRGLDRTRAHLHFEFALLLSENFATWQSLVFPDDPNPHGLYNGLNLVGINPAELLLAIRENPARFRLTDHLRAQPVQFQLAIPNSPNFTLTRRYPWLVDSATAGYPPTWIISFTEFGTPVRAEPSTEALAEPTVVSARPTRTPYVHSTKGIVTGPPGRPILSDAGRRFAALLTMPPAPAP